MCKNNPGIFYNKFETSSNINVAVSVSKSKIIVHIIMSVYLPFLRTTTVHTYDAAFPEHIVGDLNRRRIRNQTDNLQHKQHGFNEHSRVAHACITVYDMVAADLERKQNDNTHTFVMRTTAEQEPILALSQIQRCQALSDVE